MMHPAEDRPIEGSDIEEGPAGIPDHEGPMRPFLVLEVTTLAPGADMDEINAKAEAFYKSYDEDYICEAPLPIVGQGKVLIWCSATRIDIAHANRELVGAANAHVQIGGAKEIEAAASQSVLTPPPGARIANPGSGGGAVPGAFR